MILVNNRLIVASVMDWTHINLAEAVSRSLWGELVS